MITGRQTPDTFIYSLKSLLSVRNPVHSKDIPVFRGHSVSLSWVASILHLKIVLIIFMYNVHIYIFFQFQIPCTNLKVITEKRSNAY